MKGLIRAGSESHERSFLAICISTAFIAGKKFLDEEDGQAITEYILILSACIFGASTLARGILKALDDGVLRLGGWLEKDLKSGRAPLSAWQN